MPGRYSHSVVLAGYSSQGIITLPNNEYLQNSSCLPPPKVRRVTSVKSASNTESNPRSQSAMSMRTGRHTPIFDRPQSSARHYILSDDQCEPAPAIRNVRSPAFGRTSLDSRQSHRSAPFTSLSPREPQTSNPYVHQRLGQPARRAPDQQVSEPTAVPDRANYGLDVAEDRSGPSSSSIRNGVSQQRAGQGYGRGGYSVAKARAAARPPVAPSATNGLRISNISTRTTQTQIWNPVDAPEEPNFDGFSDVAENEVSYFSVRSSNVSRVSNHTDTGLQASEERSSPLPEGADMMTKSRQSYSRGGYSPSVTNSERNTATTPDRSVGKVASIKSVSSFGSLSKHPVAKPTDAARLSLQPSITHWRLPEIEEDAVFDGEIFAQDLDHSTSPVLSDNEFGESSFGMISSGRDVDFTVDVDSEDEADAACPPDIGRYRDSDDVTTPRLVAITKNDDFRAVSPTVQSRKGFFSRLKDKRNWL